MEMTIEFVDSLDFRTVNPGDLLADPPVRLQEHAAAPADTPPYLAALYDFPLLSREEEFQWFRKRNFLLFQAAQLQKKLTLSRLNASLVRQIHDRLRQAKEVRNQIVQSNLRLVVSIAKTMVDSANSLDDLISEGNLPLIRAAEIFDFTRGLRFSTYATWAIKHGLYRASHRNRRATQRFRCNDPEQIENIPGDVSGPDKQPEPIDSQLWEARLRQLDKRSQIIVGDRFGLSGQPRPAKFRELAGKLKLSSERVRQLLRQALQELREMEPSGE